MTTENRLHQTPADSATRDVPAHALTFRGGELEFAEAAADAKTFPFTMRARSSGVINHWYWGRIVHDMKGMQLRKPTCPIDYCHNDSQVIGVGEKFQAGNDGLNVSGQLVALATDASDRAFEVATKAKNKIPYEASIDWRGPGILIEEVGEGVSVEVNGQQFEGPLTVVRKWPLRAVAVCPYGADPGTATQFSEQNGKDLISVCLFSAQSEGQNVTKSATETPPAGTAGNPPAGTQQHSQAPAGQVSLETMQQFTKQFGAAKANEYLLTGLTFDQAEKKFQADRIAALEAENKQLKDASASAAAAAIAAGDQTRQLADKVLGETAPLQTPAVPGGAGKKTFSDLVKVPKSVG